MKMNRLLIVLIASFIALSCEKSIDQPIPIQSTEYELANPGPEGALTVHPLQDLFVSNISHGNFYFISPIGQALALSDGSPVCHSDFAANTFHHIPIRSDAADGIYSASNGVEIGYFSGNIVIIPESFQYDINAQEYSYKVAKYLNCPEGFGGLVVYSIKSSAQGGRLRTVEEEEDRIQCAGSHLESRAAPDYKNIDLSGLKIRPYEDIFWETPYGETLDLWCLFNGGLTDYLNQQ